MFRVDWLLKVEKTLTEKLIEMKMSHLLAIHSKQNWVVVSNIFYFHPYLGKILILTNIFQVGWNQQPEMTLGNPYQKLFMRALIIYEASV